MIGRSHDQVTGDLGFLESQLTGMIRMWHLWDYTFDSDAGLYYYTPNFDAQEYSLPGFVETNGTNNQLELDGPNTYRPSTYLMPVNLARAPTDFLSSLLQVSTLIWWPMREPS